MQSSCSVIRQLRGAIVCLDELGHLSCGYLGTDPTLFVATLANSSRELNYDVRRSEEGLGRSEEGWGGVRKGWGGVRKGWGGGLSECWGGGLREGRLYRRQIKR